MACKRSSVLRSEVTRGRLINQFKERRSDFFDWARAILGAGFAGEHLLAQLAQRTAGRSVARSLATVTISADRATLAGHLPLLVPAHAL